MKVVMKSNGEEMKCEMIMCSSNEEMVCNEKWNESEVMKVIIMILCANKTFSYIVCEIMWNNK